MLMRFRAPSGYKTHFSKDTANMTTFKDKNNTHIQWAKASLPAEGKDEDAVFAIGLQDKKRLLVGVADGISNANGRSAAQWIAKTMNDLASKPQCVKWSIRELYTKMVQSLKNHVAEVDSQRSRSTLTCGFVSTVETSHGQKLRFDFFALGDSPVWVVRFVNRGSFRYQASVIYDAPVPSEMSVLYSWLDLEAQEISGHVHFGTVELDPDDLLMVMSDGIPEHILLMQDQEKERGNSPQMLDAIKESFVLNDEILNKLLMAYQDQHLLIDDDASAVVVRLCKYDQSLNNQTGQSMIVFHTPDPNKRSPKMPRRNRKNRKNSQ